MPYDLKVSLENIIPLTYARDHFSNIVNEVQRDKLYILTKGGKPAVAIIDVRYLEQLTGGQIKQTQIKEEINKNPEQVGLPKMVGHQTAPVQPSNTPPQPQKENFGSLRFKPVPPPSHQETPTPPAAPKPTPTPVPPPPKPPVPSTPLSKPNPVPPPPAPKTNFPPPPAPTTPVAPPKTNPLILPEEETKTTPPPASAPSAPVNDGPKIEVEFSTDNADFDGKASPPQNRTNPDDMAPQAQYRGEDREPEEMDIG